VLITTIQLEEGKEKKKKKRRSFRGVQFAVPCHIRRRHFGKKKRKLTNDNEKALREMQTLRARWL